MRRLVAGLFGGLLLVAAFFMESKASVLIAVIGAVIVMSVIPYGSTAMRRAGRHK